MLLSLVTHAVGYKMIVGAHNTVYVRRMWEVLSYSPCMANDGTHNTVDAQRHGGYRVCHGMGVVDAHDTVGQMSTPTTLLWF